MRLRDRWNYLRQAEKLAWDILFRGQYDFAYDLMPVHTPDMPLRKRLNLVRAGANLIHRRAHAWSWPINMHVELTNYCNLNCRVCPTGTDRLGRRPKAIDPALFERVMDEVGTGTRRAARRRTGACSGGRRCRGRARPPCRRTFGRHRDTAGRPVAGIQPGHLCRE